MSNRKNSRPKEIINNDLPILYVDGAHTGHRGDGINYVSLTTNIPNYTVEQVRLMIDDRHLPHIIDALCQILNYFPEKPSKKRRGPSK